jgi:hypothetical protein
MLTYNVNSSDISRRLCLRNRNLVGRKHLASSELDDHSLDRDNEGDGTDSPTQSDAAPEPTKSSNPGSSKRKTQHKKKKKVAHGPGTRCVPVL